MKPGGAQIWPLNTIANSVMLEDSLTRLEERAVRGDDQSRAVRYGLLTRAEYMNLNYSCRKSCTSILLGEDENDHLFKCRSVSTGAHLPRDARRQKLNNIEMAEFQADTGIGLDLHVELLTI